MPTDWSTYWERTQADPTLLPERPISARDFYRAWDRFQRMAFVVSPRALDRAKKFRNQYDNAVGL